MRRKRYYIVSKGLCSLLVSDTTSMTFALKLFLGLLTQATHTQVRTSSENQFFCWQIFFLIGRQWRKCGGCYLRIHRRANFCFFGRPTMAQRAAVSYSPASRKSLNIRTYVARVFNHLLEVVARSGKWQKCLDFAFFVDNGARCCRFAALRLGLHHPQERQ